MDRRFADNLVKAGKKAEPSDATGALAGLGVMVALSSFVFLRRLRAE
ncbi:MAG: hypothetical protein NTV51_03510 [Verrucomicrobia bacterium]|nr:hypothetical protein [Verrucomicrobiota bacterium]